MSSALAGKVAVVTGGASGIGRACVERFAREGAHLVVADLHADRGEEAVRAAKELGAEAFFLETDTSSELANETLAEAAVDRFEKIDVLVAAAGVSSADYVSGVFTNPLSEEEQEANLVINKPVEQWQRVLDINLTGVLLSDRAVAKRMIERGEGGAIVNIASVAAKVPLAGAADYCVSKAGVWMLTKVLANELIEHGIRVNAVGPGFIDTPMTAAMQDQPEGHEMIMALTPMGRLGTPDEIASAVLHLATPESSFTTGQILYPGGGIYVG